MRYESVKDYFVITCSGVRSSSYVARYNIERLSSLLTWSAKCESKWSEEMIDARNMFDKYTKQYKIWQPSLNEFSLNEFGISNNNEIVTFTLLFKYKIDADIYVLTKSYLQTQDKLGVDQTMSIYQNFKHFSDQSLVDFRYELSELKKIAKKLKKHRPEWLLNETIQYITNVTEMDEELYGNVVK